VQIPPEAFIKMKKEMIIIFVLFLLAGCSSGFPDVVTGDFREPLAPCRDTDGGANFYVPGQAIDYYLIRTDYCLWPKTLVEAVCTNFQMSEFITHECEEKCELGACVTERYKSEFVFPGYYEKRGSQNIYSVSIE